MVISRLDSSPSSKNRRPLHSNSENRGHLQRSTEVTPLLRAVDNQNTSSRKMITQELKYKIIELKEFDANYNNPKTPNIPLFQTTATKFEGDPVAIEPTEIFRPYTKIIDGIYDKLNKACLDGSMDYLSYRRGLGKIVEGDEHDGEFRQLAWLKDDLLEKKIITLEECQFLEIFSSVAEKYCREPLEQIFSSSHIKPELKQNLEWRFRDTTPSKAPENRIQPWHKDKKTAGTKDEIAVAYIPNGASGTEFIPQNMKQKAKEDGLIPNLKDREPTMEDYQKAVGPCDYSQHIRSGCFYVWLPKDAGKQLGKDYHGMGLIHRQPQLGPDAPLRMLLDLRFSSEKPSFFRSIFSKFNSL